MEITAKTEVSTKEIALILGVTPRWIQKLTQNGILSTKSSKGPYRYNLAETIRAYIEYYIPKKDTTLETEKEAAELLIKQSKAIVAELEAKELQGIMHRSEDVRAITEDLVYTIRVALLALPGRLAVDVVNAKSSAEAAEIIKQEVYITMGELSNYQYDPEKYEERVRERKKWSSSIEFDGLDIEGGEV